MREQGFSIIELMVAMAVFVLTIAAASNVFLSVLTQFKQQSKISESSMDDMIGLEILQRDIENAGYGLPWIIPVGVAYNETVIGYDDAPSNPPRGIVSGNGAGVNGSDYLVIKAVNVVSNNVAQNWTWLQAGPVSLNGLSGQSFDVNDNVMVISPGTSTADARTLVVNGLAFATTYGATGSFVPSGLATNIIYGVDPGNMRMPFNRADYFISNANVPSRCAPGTGVLVKGEVSQVNGSLTTYPLMDCVADMQVVYQTDANGDMMTDGQTNNMVLLSAQQIRTTVKEVRVYILAHEGQLDRNFTYLTNPVTVGEFGLGQSFDFTVIPITNWPNYRWKVYTMVVRLDNLNLR